MGHASTSAARPGSFCGLRDAVLEDHAPTVVVFTRCPDFSDHMRIDGGVLDHDLLASIDGLRSAAGASLCEDLFDHSWWEATTAVAHGGLGFRAALSVALLSFVLDRVTSKPFVRTMVEHFLRGHLGHTIVSVHHTHRRSRGSPRFHSPRCGGPRVCGTTQRGTRRTGASVTKCGCRHGGCTGRSSGTGTSTRGMTPEDGDGDDEHPRARKRMKVQGVTTLWIDKCVREGLLQMHEGEGSWTACTRLSELGDIDVDYTWHRCLNSCSGLVLDADELTDSVKFRVGCAGPMEPNVCAECNSGLLNTGAVDDSCCAPGGATRIHHAVTNLIHAAAKTCDHAAETEVPGLILGTDLRPADVLASSRTRRWTSPFAHHTLWEQAWTARGPWMHQTRVWVVPAPLPPGTLRSVQDRSVGSSGSRFAVCSCQPCNDKTLTTPRWSACGRRHRDTLLFESMMATVSSFTFDVCMWEQKAEFAQFISL